MTFLKRLGDVIHQRVEANQNLLISAANGHLDRVVQHLADGARVDAEDGQGRQALHHAASKNDHLVVAVLLKHGASVHAVSRDGQTPLHMNAMGMRSMSEGRWAGILQETLNHTGKLTDLRDRTHTIDEAPLSMECMNQLLSAGASVNMQDRRGDTVLHTSCKLGTLQPIRVLLMGGSDVNAVNKHGQTPLHAIAGATQISLKCAIECATTLIRRQAKTDLKDRFDRTFIEFAEEMGNQSFVESMGPILSSQDALNAIESMLDMNKVKSPTYFRPA